jgi:hypothetical protein
LVYFGDTKPLRETLKLIHSNQELADFAALVENATPDSFDSIAADQQFDVLVATVSGQSNGADAALLLGAVVGPPPLVNGQAFIQLLLGTIASPEYLRDTAKFVRQIMIDVNIFGLLQNALVSLMQPTETEIMILREILPVLKKYLEENMEQSEIVIDLPPEKVCDFVVTKSIWNSKWADVAMEVVDFGALCGRVNDGFGEAVKVGLWKVPQAGRNVIGWGLMLARIAIARKIPGDVKVQEIVRIARNLSEVSCWVILVERLCELTQRIEGKWVAEVWKAMLEYAPESVVGGGRAKVAFEAIFRVLDERMERSEKIDFLHKITGNAPNNSKAELITRTWTGMKD